MIRTAMDTDNLAALDGAFPIIMTYSDLVPVPSQLQVRFPNSELVLIDRKLGDPSGQASIIDIEPGAWDVSEARSWFEAKIAARVPFLTAYSDRAELAAIDAALAGVPHFRWIATLDGTVHIPGYTPLRSPAVVQILDAAHSGAPIDISLVLEDNWHPTLAVPDISAALTSAESALTATNTAVAAMQAVVRDLMAIG